jgi:hypothetical protein
VRLLVQQSALSKIAEEDLDVAVGAIPRDIKRLDETIDQCLSRASRGEQRPQLRCRSVRGDVLASRAIDCQNLALDLAPRDRLDSQPHSALSLARATEAR